MSVVEDLPDDSGLPMAPVAEPAPGKLPIDASKSTPFPIGREEQVRNGTTPELPPQMASVRSHTADEILQMMNRTPLFMTSLEGVEEDEGENIELEAMRALQYEGTPAEIAQGFKEQGNEMVKVKRWKDGKEYYTKAVAVLINSSHPSTSIVEEVAESPSDRGKEEGAEEEKILLEACFVNRALCNLELKNFRSTTLDCASALRLNPQNVKAYYRSSTALLALEKLVEASDACARGLIINPGNAPLKALDAKIKARKELFWDGQEKKRQQAERAHKEKIALATALRARNIVTRTTSQPPDMEDANIHLAPHPLSPTSTLQFPVILLYPLHAQSDFIKSFPETDTVPIHLEYIFPLPWDKEQEYKSGGVEFYMTTSDGGLVKVGKKVSLGKVLGSGGIEILDGLVRIYVLPKARAAHWIGEMRMRKGRSVG